MPLTAANLPKFHTRELIKALRMSCASQLQLDRIDEERAFLGLGPMYTTKEAYYERAYVHPWAFGYDDCLGSDLTVAQLKAELATRPHVPNKQESRLKRQVKAKLGRTRGRRDR